MNDDVQPSDTPSDELLAVSASIDGVATADERAIVEASPELSALADELRANARSVAQVDVPPTARESAMTAALAAFDHLNDAVPAAAATPTNVVSIGRRRTWYRAITGAAAALLLVVGGVAAIRASDGSDSDDASTAIDVSPSAKTADTATAAGAAAGTMSDQASAADAAESAEAPAETEMPTQLPMSASDTAAPGDSTAPDRTDSGPASTVPPTIGVIPGPAEADSDPAIDDEQQLATYVASARVDSSSRTAACVPDGGESLGDVSYQGTLALVARDPDSGEVMVFAVDDCRLLATIST
jgi:hypothetical protein